MINLKSQVNLIWGLGELAYSNDKVNQFLEQTILLNVNNYDFIVRFTFSFFSIKFLIRVQI